GGIATALDGSKLDLEKGDVLAGNPALHPQVIKLLKV
ncbi:MAG: inositol monophosphatase, partial [Zetaproteobacteria bacterium CG_4_9_14_3_um_filter_53_7]